MNDRIHDRNHPQMQIRATSCDFCGVERARYFVQTAYGERHCCESCRAKYEIRDSRKG